LQECNVVAQGQRPMALVSIRAMLKGYTRSVNMLFRTPKHLVPPLKNACVIV